MPLCACFLICEEGKCIVVKKYEKYVKEEPFKNGVVSFEMINIQERNYTI